MGMASLVTGLWIDCISRMKIEWTDVLHGANSHCIVVSMIFGWVYRNWQGYLVYETLKSAVSKECVYELS